MKCRLRHRWRDALPQIAAIVLLAGWWSPAAAQTPAAQGQQGQPAQMNMADHRGGIRGVVRNESGAPVAGATVTAISAENGAKFEATTDTQGAYSFTALPVGNYEITISSSGMMAFRRTGVGIEMDRTGSLDIMLNEHGTAHADGRLMIEGAWIRAAPPGAHMRAGYATLRNGGDAPLVVRGARSDAFGEVSMHSTQIEDGIARMRELPEITLAPGERVVLVAHDHVYERLAPHDATGAADASGVRAFTVGTGGARLYAFKEAHALSEVRDGATHGVLRLTLGAGRYRWAFVGIEGEVRDVGEGACR